MATRRALRRKLHADALDVLPARRHTCWQKRKRLVFDASKMSGNADLNERQHHNSKTDSSNFEPSLEQEWGEGQVDTEPDKPEQTEPRIPLALVLKACPDIQPYSPHEINNSHKLVGVAGLVRGMMGISPAAWAEAQRAMGPENVASMLAVILQRVEDIRSPGGYLRRLTQKAEIGGILSGADDYGVAAGTES